MRALDKVNLKDVVFVDIETAPLVPKLELDTPLFESWSYMNRNKNLSNTELIELYDRESALYAEFARAVCISVGRINKDKLSVRTYIDLDEGKMLEEFNNDLYKVTSSNRKTQFCGHASKTFDLPFLFKRLIVNQIKPHDLIDSSGLKPWEVTGIDTMELWKGSSYMNSSLLSISTALGLPSPKDDISGANVGKLFWSNEKDRLRRIADYCEKDVLTTSNILRRFKFEPLLEMDKSDIKLEEVPIFNYLMNGGRYGAKHKKELIEVFKSLNEDEREKGVNILNAIVSNAKDKKTKFQKAHIKAIIESL